MQLREFEWAREIAPGFALVLRWPRVNVWPYLHAQFWTWSLTFRPMFAEKVFGPELVEPPAAKPKRPRRAAKRVVMLDEI